MGIDGVTVSPLKQFLDERGKVMRMLREDDEVFQRFGEIYFSRVYSGVVKGWHMHERMTLHYAVPHGRVKLVLYDDRSNSPTKGELQQIILGPDNYKLVKIPPQIWNGFKGLGSEMALVANCSTLPHDPDEIDRKDPLDSSIPYDWDVQHG